jgi:hypothetical protein
MPLIVTEDADKALSIVASYIVIMVACAITALIIAATRRLLR